MTAEPAATTPALDPASVLEELATLRLENATLWQAGSEVMVRTVIPARDAEALFDVASVWLRDFFGLPRARGEKP